MTVGFAVFGAAFLIGLALGTYTRRPFLAACFLTGCFGALVAGAATDRPLPAAATFGLIVLAGAVIDSVRETFTLLLGR
jgi:cell division protein FtsX